MGPAEAGGGGGGKHRRRSPSSAGRREDSNDTWAAAVVLAIGLVISETTSPKGMGSGVLRPKKRFGDGEEDGGQGRAQAVGTLRQGEAEAEGARTIVKRCAARTTRADEEGRGMAMDTCRQRTGWR
ncbi:hypothetical protein CCHR01_05423 [Colletotrichum chrysophilum]|uniref:Uncharacterized protein n=1 Tax=Colletotrichum chrysophilum TaxID=1836956 RepID=A0AAD9AR39_9PEZI|nr:hypothetical protein CCHR01_05423 [Colletotrichum chrysophilum]